MANKDCNIFFSNKPLANELMDSHVYSHDKYVAATMDVCTRSSLDFNSVDIGEITESPDTDHMSTSAILHYCKSKILFPYLKLLSFMGLRPVSMDVAHPSRFIICLSHIHSMQVAVFMFLGYILQYMACFRRDRGFCYNLVPLARTSSIEYENYIQICYGSVTFSYIGPSILHFIGFLYALYLFRISDTEQLQNLMERVFLLSSFPPQSMQSSNPKRLLRTLWCFIILSLIWMCLSLCTVNIMMANGTIMFRWIDKSSNQVKICLKVLLIVCTLVHDMVQATIISSYCLQAQLLQTHLIFSKERLLNRNITPLDWMREVSEFRKLLKYLNEDLAPAVCFFTIVNISWACSGIAWLLNFDKIDTDTLPIVGISVLNQVLWTSASVVPFIQAARLSTECSSTQAIGHEICVRPFLHQDTSQEDIVTILMFASTLKLSAKLFRCPIEGKYLCLFLTFATIALFILGMCHYLQG